MGSKGPVGRFFNTSVSVLVTESRVMHQIVDMF